MADHKSRIVVSDLSGGRNAIDAPWEIAANQCVDAVDVEFYKAPFGRKRQGIEIDAASYPGAPGPFTGIISFLFPYTPGADSTNIQLFAVDDAGVVGILTKATMGFVSVGTIKDTVPTDSWHMTGVMANGMGFITHSPSGGTVFRMHVLDSSGLRRAGLIAPAIPTVADSGSGTYAAVLRYYRIRWTVQASGITVRRSEPSPIQSFTPSGSGQFANVSIPTLAGEGETHFEVEASIDGVTFYRIATVALAGSPYRDAAATTTYNTNPLSALTGTYTLQKAYKFIGGDQNRTLGLGSWLSTDKQNRLEISAVVGSLDVGDAERIDTTINYFLDFDESDSGQSTGLAGPIDGFYFVFKEKQIWKLTATGTTSQPYRADAVSKVVGAIEHYAITSGLDKDGNAALYWMSYQGMFQWTTAKGMIYIGRGIEDYVLGPTANIVTYPGPSGPNPGPKVTARAQYIASKKQVRFWWAVIAQGTGTPADPNCGATYDINSGGWTRTAIGSFAATVRCSALFPNTIGLSAGNNFDRLLYAWLGITTFGTAALGIMDQRGLNDGNGSTAISFKAYITTRAYESGGAGNFGECGDAILIATGSGNVTTITDVITQDFGLDSKTVSVAITAAGTEAFVIKRLEDSGMSGGRFYQHTLGDGSAVDSGWKLDRLLIPIVARGQSSS